MVAIALGFVSHLGRIVSLLSCVSAVVSSDITINKTLPHDNRSEIERGFPCQAPYTENVEICNQFENEKTSLHDKTIFFTFCGHYIEVYINSTGIDHPDVSHILKNIHQEKEFPPRSLNFFYVGRLIISNLTVKFTAVSSETGFMGQSSYFGSNLKLKCKVPSANNLDGPSRCLLCVILHLKIQVNTESTNNSKTTNGAKLNHIDDVLYSFHHFDFYLRHLKLSSQYDEDALGTDIDLSRHKRFASTRFSCTLHVVADYLFFHHVGEEDVEATIGIMFNVVNEVSAMFRATDFDGDFLSDHIGLEIAKVTVLQDKKLTETTSEEKISMDEFLLSFALNDFDGFCLGIAFTAKDLGKVAGLSFSASSHESTPGGICQRRLSINGSRYSLNTVAVTFMADGKIRDQTEVAMTLAHEIGHSFGAHHDIGRCTFHDKYGSYIMSPETLEGKLPNNRKFSSCSVNSMLPVIKKKGSCFKEGMSEPQCGNIIIESGEECDCGDSKLCAYIDPCCTPADLHNSTDKPCTVRRSIGHQCSPKTSPCCSQNCTLFSNDRVCNNFDQCVKPSHCNGHDDLCPEAPALDEGSRCENGLKVCTRGECSVNTCEHHNMTSCFCSKDIHRCKLCCFDKLCRPASEHGIFANQSDVIYLQVGMTCDHGKICDKNNRCVSKTVTTPTYSFASILPIQRFTIYVEKYWVYVVFFTVTSILVFCTLFKSYLPNDPIALRALRYGKMMAIIIKGESESKRYRKKAFELVDQFNNRIEEAEQGNRTMDYVRAVARLKSLFPEVSIDHLAKVAKFSAREEDSVRILLTQDFSIRTFT